MTEEEQEQQEDKNKRIRPRERVRGQKVRFLVATLTDCIQNRHLNLHKEALSPLPRFRRPCGRMYPIDFSRITATHIPVRI